MWTQATKVGVHAKSKGHVDSRMQLKEKAMQLKIDATKRRNYATKSRGHATKSGHAMINGELHIYSIFFPILILSPLIFFSFSAPLS